MSAPASQLLDRFPEAADEVYVGRVLERPRRNRGIDGATPPPSMLKLATDFAKANGREMKTTRLLRGAPRTDARGRVTYEVVLDDEQREYPPARGFHEQVETVKRVAIEQDGLPEDIDLTFVPGGRPGLDLVIKMFDRESTVFLTADIAYSAVSALLDMNGSNYDTVPVDVKNFNIQAYLDSVIAKVDALIEQGVESLVFMETLPGNPLGIEYPEELRLPFFKKLRARGVVVAVDNFYPTYKAPPAQGENSNYPYSPFRGIESSEGILVVKGFTKDGPDPNPALRLAYVAGDPQLINDYAIQVQAAAGGGVSAPSQIVLAQDLAEAFDAQGKMRPDHFARLIKFSQEIVETREYARKRLTDMGFIVYGDDGSGIGDVGMYLMARRPEGKPNFVRGFKEWSKVGVTPGLPLNNFVVNPGQRAHVKDYIEDTGLSYPYEDEVRICIGAGMARVRAALDALEYGLDEVRAA